MNENWKRIGPARVAQIERVNGDKPAAAQTVTFPDPFANVPPTRNESALLAKIARLEAELADLRAKTSGLHYGSRPVFTSKQAAEALGRSVSTVSRYCASGHLAHVRVNGELFVYADQPLQPKERRGKRK